MIKRLITFYNGSRHGATETMSGIWSSISGAHHANLDKALTAEDEVAVNEILHGFLDSLGISGIESSEIIQWSYPIEKVFYLERLAQQIGILPIGNPEQESPTENWKMKDVLAIKSEVEKSLGFELCVPDYLGYKFQGDNLGVPHRFFH